MRAVATVQNRRALLLAVPRFVVTVPAVVDAVLKGQAQRVGVANRGALGHGLPRVELDVVVVHAGRGEMRVAGRERTGPQAGRLADAGPRAGARGHVVARRAAARRHGGVVHAAVPRLARGCVPHSTLYFSSEK